MKNKGFSLIELLTVLLIIGILTTIAYPGYRNYIIRAHRSDGQTALLDLANSMERYYSENNSYQNATIGSGRETDVVSSNESNGGWYSLSITHATDSDYALQAAPIKTQATSDTQCQSFTFNSFGARGITTGPSGAPTGTSTQCW